MRHFVTLLLAATALSGCVLHSDEPLFSDAEATALLGHKALTVTLSGHGAARSETLQPTENHYTVTSDFGGPLSLQAMYFIRLDPTHFVLQSVGNAGADYAIATQDASGLSISPLDCAALKTHLASNALVQLRNSSCGLRPGNKPPAQLFAAILPAAPKASLRLTVQK